MNELQELQALMQELLGAIEETMQSGEVLDDALQGEIAKTLELLYSRIESLQVQGPVEQMAPPPPQNPKMTGSMPSSNVNATGYDPETGRLLVQFLGKYPNRQGGTYAYDNVPPFIANIIEKGGVPARTTGSNKWGAWWKGKIPSMGAAVSALLKESGVPFQRLS